MAIVTITVTPSGVVVNPENVPINRVDQTITWQLNGATWEPNGIVFDENPPAPFKPWPGPQATQQGNTFVVNAGDPLPPGAQAENYRYTIHIVDPAGVPHTKMIAASNPELVIDPEIVNEPQP
jgi:hypothetical protein